MVAMEVPGLSPSLAGSTTTGPGGTLATTTTMATILVAANLRTIQSSLSWLGRACSIIPLEPVKMKGKDAPRCTDVRA